jgi:KDO2-lipid IV(A) lauroyltransferase
MVKFILKTLSLFSLRLNHLIGSLIGQFLYFLNTEIKKISQENIKNCLTHLDEKQQQKVLKQSLKETGKTLFETANIWFEPKSRNLKRIKIVGGELLKINEPVIVLAPHLGCWEIVGNYLASKNNTTILYKKLRNEKANQQLVDAREGRGYALAPADKSGVIKLQKAILKKQWLGILPDQNPGKGNGLEIDFFAQKVLTMTLLVKLARKNKVQVVTAWAERLPKSKGYLIHFEKANVISQKNTVEEDCELMNKVIEKMILQKPEQYQWSYDRFKL